MRLMMVGMDGASRETFERGWTPYISNLLNSGVDLKLATDLYSRGWLEIATGAHSTRTTAMYDRPKCDGTTEWIEQFRIDDIPGLGHTIKPIWQRLNESGLRVGVMNLPTAFPVPQVDGFFVSGGGGGGAVVSTPTQNLCHPPEILTGLLDDGYIVDERIVQLVIDRKLSSPHEIFHRLAQKNDRRTRSFVRLCEEFDVDFGFVVFKTSSVLAENFVQRDWHKKRQGNANFDEEMLAALEAYYRQFDEQIKKLHESFPDAAIVFIADHGMVRRTHSVNPNRLLLDLGLQVESRVGRPLAKAVNILKRVLPFRLKKALKKHKGVSQVTANAHSFETKKTQAFCRTFGDWRYGIFVNDSKRFGGPVLNSEVEHIARRIVEAVNSDPIARTHGISATIHTQKMLSDDLSPEWFPDVMLDVPDGYLISDKAPTFVSEYSSDDEASALAAVLKGDIVSIKSTTPIASFCPGKSEVKVEPGKDLTCIPDFIEEVLSGANGFFASHEIKTSGEDFDC